MQLVKAKEENERLPLENCRIEALLTQAQEDFKNSHKEKAAFQEKSHNEALELTAVKLEHPSEKRVQNSSDTDDDIEILKIVQPVKTPYVAAGSNVEQSPVRNRAKRSSIKRGPEYHAIYACYKFRCICGSTFPSDEPLTRHLEENGVETGVLYSSKSSKRRQGSGENFSERANVQHKRNRDFEDRPLLPKSQETDIGLITRD